MNYKTFLAAYNLIKAVIKTLEEDHQRDILVASSKDVFLNWMDKVAEALRDIIACQPEIADQAQDVIAALNSAYKAGHIDAKQHNVKRSVQSFVSAALNTGDLNLIVDHIDQSWQTVKKQIAESDGYVKWGNILVDKNSVEFIGRVIDHSR